MKPVEHNTTEVDRASLIRALEDSPSRASLNKLAQMAANCMAAPIGFVSLLDNTRFQHLATCGIKPHELTIDENPHLVDEGFQGPWIVADIELDDRFRESKLTRTTPEIRFFAAVPIALDNNEIGLLGTMDIVAHQVADSQIEQLKLVQSLAESLIESHLEKNTAEKIAAVKTSLYQKNPVMSHTIDKAGVIVQVSDLWCQHFGYRREEVVGRNSIEFLTDESRNYAIEVALPNLRDTGRCTNLSFQWIRKDGSIRDVSLSAVVDQDQFGAPITLAVLTDVTDRVENQLLLEQQSAELFNTRERLETAVIGGDVGLWDWNVRDDEVNFSPVWHTQIGETPGTLHGLSAWQSRVHPDDLDEALRRVHECFDGDKSEYESIFRLRHANGSYRTILSRGRKFVDEQGLPRRLIGVHVDITERQKNEDRLSG